MNFLFRKARGLKAIVTLTRDPNRLADVFTIIDTMLTPDRLQTMVDHLKPRTESLTFAFRDRPRLGQLDLDQLAACPAETLGRELARHMRGNGLDPSALPTMAAEDDVTYLRAHLIETHDIWHVITGFEADVAGELGLQAFYLAQMPTRLAAILLCGGLINTTMFNFDDRERRLDAITRGWAMGKSAHPLFGARWHELWSKPLAELREHYQIAA